MVDIVYRDRSECLIYVSIKEGVMWIDDQEVIMSEDDEKRSEYALVEMGAFILSMALVIVVI